MPAAFAYTGERRFAEALLKLMSEHQSNNQLASIALRALSARHGGRKDVGRMGGVLFPVDVVVIHAADHQGVRQCGVYYVHLPARADYGCRAALRDLFQN